MRLNLHKNLNILSTYAPPAVSNDRATSKEETQEYYDKLSEVVKEPPNNNMIIVLGDMNARVIEAINQKEKRIIGSHALKGSSSPNDLKEETTRDNRDRLIEFCHEHELKIENAMFDKPTSNLVTFKPTFVPYTEKSVNSNIGKQTI